MRVEVQMYVTANILQLNWSRLSRLWTTSLYPGESYDTPRNDDVAFVTPLPAISVHHAVRIRF